MKIPFGCYARVVQNTGSGAFAMSYRMLVLTADGTIQPVTIAMPVTSAFNDTGNVMLPPGELISAVMTPIPAAASSNGFCYAVLELWYGAPTSGTKIGVIGSGWSQSTQPVCLYPSIPEKQWNQERAPITISGATPSAGFDFTIFVTPTYEYGLVLSVSGLLTTDATVANRVPQLEFITSSSVFISSVGNSVAIPASQAVQVSFGFQTGPPLLENSRLSVGMLPVPMFVGGRIRSRTTNLQAGDTWTAIQVVARWHPIGVQS